MHALLLVGSYEWALTVLPESVRLPGPDVMHRESGRLTIDDVRGIVKEAYLTPLMALERVFLIACDDMTIEAQNALLKIVEEPPLTSRFYIVVKREGILIPTLRSRLVLHDSEGERELYQIFSTFQTMSYGERLKAIGDHATKKDDAWMRELWRGIEHYAHTTKKPDLMRSVLAFRPHFERPGSSKKMILEHLALHV